MADYDRIMQALRAADQAGDTEGATRLAQMAREAQAPTDESYAKRAVKAIPGAFEGVARTVGNIAGAIPQGIRMAGEAIFSDASLEDSIARSESSNWMNYVPSSQTGRDTEEMLGKAMQVPIDIIAEGASVTGQEVGNILGAGEDWKNNFDAAIKSTAEGVYNLALPIPGLKAVGKVASKIAGTEGRVRQDLLRELDAQKTAHGTDPLTVGAQPNAAPWTPTKPGTQLPLDLGQIGAEAPPGLYEAGMHPDTYLKNDANPQPGQGDLFSGTKPYTPEQLPEQAARGRAAVAQAEAIAKAMEYKAPELMNPAGPEIGAPKPDLQMPSVEPPNPGLESGISFKGNAEPGVRNRPMMEQLNNSIDGQGRVVDPRLTQEANPVDIESGMSGKTFGNDPHAVEGLPPIGDGKPRYIGPNAELGKVLPESPDQFKARLAEQFPTADGSGIVKMGNGGHLDWAALTKVGKHTVDLASKGLKVLLEHVPNGITPHGNVTMKVFNSTSGKFIGGADVQLKNPYDAIEGNKVKISNIAIDKTNASKRAGLEIAKIAKGLGDLDTKSAGSTQDGQRLAAILDRKAERDKSPYDNDGPIYMANGGFISPEFQKKAFEFVKTSIMGKAKNTINGMTEQARLMSMDHSTAAEVVNSLDPKTIEDFGGVARAFSNATDQSGMARIARDYKGSGTLINWLNDRIKYIDRKYGTIKEDLLKGTEYVKSLRGFEFRTTSDKSPVKLMQDVIKKDWEGSREMLKEWFNASRDGREPSFKNPEHQVVYDAWQKVFDYSRIHMNALRVKAGLEPIGKQTAYFPLMRMGDWRVVAEDANGNLVGAWHLPNKIAAWQFKKLLAKDSPDLKVGDVHHLKQSKYDYKNSDFTALEAANAALKSQPDVLAAVTKAYAEAIGHKGFGGKHAVQSEHVLGAMGLDYSRKGVVDALKAFEMYTERSMDYIAGLEKKQAMADLVAEIGKKPELQGKIENTLAHMTDMFELSRDSLKDELSGVTKTLDWVARTSMLGEKGAASVMRDMNGLVSSWLLSTASFALSQIVQPATGLAGLTIAEGGGIKGFGLAGVDTFKGLYKTFFPDQLGREGVSWAAKKGYITPEVAELYGSRHISAHDSMAREVISHPVKSYLRGFSFISQALEKQAVRIPYFLMQLEALKGQITDKNMLFETAAQATDRYMVDYARQNQAMLWQRMGAIGTGVKPLKQFSNNFLGQFAEFASEAKHGDLVPMAVMLGTSIMLAGLAGNIVVQTADDMIRGINAISNANIPTIHEKVMEIDKDNKLNKNVKSVAQFGIGSSILGYDVSSSVAQNSVKSMFTIPVGEVPFKITKDLGTYLFKDWKGKATEADMMKAYLAITPPSLKEYMRNQFVVNGAVPNASRNMMLEYQRGPEEMKANEGFFGMQNLLSRPSLNEAQARAINRAAAENLREQALDKKSSAAVLADNLISGKPITPEMLQNYIKEGGDPRNLPTLVRNRIMGKTFTEIDQQQMKKGISGVAAREAIKDETKAQSNLQKQSWGDHTKREDLIPEEVRGTDLKWKGPRGTGKNYQPMGRTDYDPMPPMGQPQQRVLDDLAPALKVPGNPTIPRVPYVDPKLRLERLRAMQGVM